MQGVYKRPIADPADQWGDAADRCMNVGVLCSLQRPTHRLGNVLMAGLRANRTISWPRNRFTPRLGSSWSHHVRYSEDYRTSAVWHFRVF